MNYRALHQFNRGFTIVELLVVIVVIGILATITIVSYTGISQKATVASLQADLANASKQLKIFQVTNSGFPDSITDCGGSGPAAGNVCLKPSGSNIYASYVKDNTINPQGFCINMTNGMYSYKISSFTYNTPVVGTCIGELTTTNITATGLTTWTIPLGVTSVLIDAWGAQGSQGGGLGAQCGNHVGGAGGRGGHSTGTLSGLTPGNPLYVNVGTTSGGGAGGGGYQDPEYWYYYYAGGGAGGGASDVRYGSNILANRKIVAGGGGGGEGALCDEYNTSGWDGGVGGTGGGTNGSGNSVGTQTSGYALGVGGPGTDQYGGGGAGYWGGSNGGGGSGYIGGVTGGVMANGVRSGNGLVTLTYTPLAPF